MKKLWIFLLLLLLFILIILCWKYCCKTESKYVCEVETEVIKIPKGNNGDSTTTTRSWCKNEFIVSYCGYTDTKRDSLHKYLVDKGYQLKDSCACSAKLELWYSPVGLIPDGGEVKDKGIATGWEVVRNFTIDDKLNTFEALQPLNSDLFDGKPPRPTTKYPQASSSTKKVIIAIEDSGVNEGDAVLTPYLYRNNPSALFCNTTIAEGRVGMNILNRLGGGVSDPVDTDGHGTFISGIIAGAALPTDYTSDNENINIQQLHVKFMNARGEGGDLFSALCGIHYAISKGAKVINASWRVRTKSKKEDTIMRRVFCPTMDDIMRDSVLIIAGAGNDTMDLDGIGKSWPAVFSKAVLGENDYSSNVISVGAWDVSTSKIADFSNFGSYVDVYALGIHVTSTSFDTSPAGIITNNSVYKTGKGTSYAAPFVTRTAAILRGLHPTASPQSIKECIKKFSIENTALGIKILDINSVKAKHAVFFPAS